MIHGEDACKIQPLVTGPNQFCVCMCTYMCVYMCIYIGVSLSGGIYFLTYLRFLVQPGTSPSLSVDDWVFCQFA